MRKRSYALPCRCVGRYTRGRQAFGGVSAGVSSRTPNSQQVRRQSRPVGCRYNVGRGGAVRSGGGRQVGRCRESTGRPEGAVTQQTSTGINKRIVSVVAAKWARVVFRESQRPRPPTVNGVHTTMKELVPKRSNKVWKVEQCPAVEQAPGQPGHKNKTG